MLSPIWVRLRVDDAKDACYTRATASVPSLNEYKSPSLSVREMNHADESNTSIHFPFDLV